MYRPEPPVGDAFLLLLHRRVGGLSITEGITSTTLPPCRYFVPCSIYHAVVTCRCIGIRGPLQRSGSILGDLGTLGGAIYVLRDIGKDRTLPPRRSMVP